MTGAGVPRQRRGPTPARWRPAGVLALLLLVWSAVAHAGPRVAVVGFSGPSAEGLQEQVATMLRRDCKVVPPERVDGELQRIDAGGLDARTLVRLAEELQADGVLLGELTRRGQKLRLVLKMHDGRSGKRLGTVAVLVGGSRLTTDERMQLRQELGTLRALLTTGGDRGASLGRAPARGRGRAARGDATEEEVLVEDGRDRRDADSDAAAGEEEGGAEEDDSAEDGGEEAGPTRPAAPRAMASAGLDLWSRSLTFRARAGADVARFEYHGGLVPALRIGGELYPLLDGRLGFTAQLRYAPTIKTVTSDPATQLATTQYHLAAGVAGRLALGPALVQAGVRLNRLVFDVDRAGAPADYAVPNVAYLYLDPGASVLYPVARRISVLAEARFVAVLAGGELLSAEQFGAASMIGVDAQVQVHYDLSSPWQLAGGLELVAVRLDFKDGGALSGNAEGASERYLVLQFGVRRAFE